MAISAKNVAVTYGSHLALRGVTFELEHGSSVAVIGPNGSGKSTLLGAIAGTVELSAGSLRITGDGPALVLQSTNVDPSLPVTVRDTVSLARYPTLRWFQRFSALDRAAVEAAMRRLGVDDLASRQIHELSGGQRQRTLVAQGLAQESDVLLLDEPVTGLDVASRHVILDLIDDEVAQGKAVVVTTHDLDEARRCDRVLLLNTGMVALGTPEEVLIAENLRRVFGGQLMELGDELFLDDAPGPDHDHDH
ncbi:MAG: zinc ABC transporter ATP-binding protein AztA [Actinomycetota bacterium]